MRVWIIEEGEPLPIEGSKGRIMRCGIICKMLSEKGHDVTWFTSNFSHSLKKRVRDNACIEQITDNYRINLLHAKTVYKNNVSLGRIKYFKQLAKEFIKETKKSDKPDIIFCGFPSIEFSYEAVRYGQDNNVPVAIDVRDLWPDIFYLHVPPKMQHFARLFLKNAENKTKYIMQKADAVFVITPPWLNTYVAKKGRIINNYDKAFYLAYDKKANVLEITNDEVADFSKKFNIFKSDFNICFYGNMGEVIDFEPVVKAFGILKNRNINAKLFLCGAGQKLDEFKQKALGLDSISFLEYINQKEIACLSFLCKAGILPYYNRFDFVDSVPNKAVEYMAYKLPQITSIQGYLKKLLENNNCGLTYIDENDLADKIEFLYNSEDKRLEIQDSAYTFFENNFDAKIVYSELIKTLEEMVVNKK